MTTHVRAAAPRERRSFLGRGPAAAAGVAIALTVAGCATHTGVVAGTTPKRVAAVWPAGAVGDACRALEAESERATERAIGAAASGVAVKETAPAGNCVRPSTPPAMELFAKSGAWAVLYTYRADRFSDDAGLEAACRTVSAEWRFAFITPDGKVVPEADGQPFHPTLELSRERIATQGTGSCDVQEGGPPLTRPGALEVLDFDGDGRLDLANQWVHENTRNPRGQYYWNIYRVNGTAIVVVAGGVRSWKDIDSDGRMEVAFASPWETDTEMDTIPGLPRFAHVLPGWQFSFDDEVARRATALACENAKSPPWALGPNDTDRERELDAALYWVECALMHGASPTLLGTLMQRLVAALPDPEESGAWESSMKTPTLLGELCADQAPTVVFPPPANAPWFKWYLDHKAEAVTPNR